MDFKQADEASIRAFIESPSFSPPILNVGDSRVIMQGLPSKCAKLVFTSPPYCLEKPRDYGGPKPEQYVQWMMSFIPQISRIMTDDGAFVLNIAAYTSGGFQMTQDLEVICAIAKSSGLGYLQCYTWHKRNCAPGSWPNRLPKAEENLYVFVKKETKGRLAINKTRVLVEQAWEWRKKRLMGNPSKGDGVRHQSTTKSGTGRKVDNWKTGDPDRPTVEVADHTNVIRMPTECSNKGHSATFPSALVEWFIKLLTNPGDMVVDPFVGSGSTCRAALKLGRLSVGIDALRNSGFDADVTSYSDPVSFSDIVRKNEVTRMKELHDELNRIKDLNSKTCMYPSVSGYQLDKLPDRHSKTSERIIELAP